VIEDAEGEANRNGPGKGQGPDCCSCNARFGFLRRVGPDARIPLNYLEAGTGIEPVFTDLQSAA